MYTFSKRLLIAFSRKNMYAEGKVFLLEKCSIGCITLAAVPRFIRAPIHTNNIFRNDIPLLLVAMLSQNEKKKARTIKKRHLIKLNPREFFSYTFYIKLH